ncbi:uncharacterized protein L969DRAFT_45103 [Mixia osmundae IAM 14324]|uniref:Uncharacterized protein n=1 Tax=Mixia osmundae (strain CBS 9802 / IAM 14324 / JCM 22182 / KY 12970) TaxID=764103 RepID=G7DTR0_MIXOS|nr:uncharacterized protein L969DRAFT_45103 [Mixia osmundae IAM 14324]KEI41685.1 hypothetical protein L969DRAFT_45103 [Mixia osmundae IAM 14324]GAA93970.1 hypothetical protein E5Q_00616 [Mixia osmundae IAM 14324]
MADTSMRDLLTDGLPVYLSTQLPTVEPGQNPFEVYLTSFNELLYPPPTRGFTARTWALVALAGLQIVITIIYMSVVASAGKVHFLRRVKRPEGTHFIVHPLWGSFFEIAAGGMVIFAAIRYYNAYVLRGNLNGIVALHATTWIPLWLAYWTHVIANTQALALMSNKTIVRPHLLNWLAYGVPVAIFAPLITLSCMAEHRWQVSLSMQFAIRAQLEQGNTAYQANPQTAIANLLPILSDYKALLSYIKYNVVLVRAISAIFIFQLGLALIMNYANFSLLKHVSETLVYNRSGRSQNIALLTGDETIPNEKSQAGTQLGTQSMGPAQGATSTLRQGAAEYTAHIHRLAGLKSVIIVVLGVGGIVCTLGIAVAIITAIKPLDVLTTFWLDEFCGTAISWAYILLIIPAKIAQIVQHFMQIKEAKMMTQQQINSDDFEKGQLSGGTAVNSADSLGLKLEMPDQSSKSGDAKRLSDLWQPLADSDIKVDETVVTRVAE